MRAGTCAEIAGLSRRRFLALAGAAAATVAAPRARAAAPNPAVEAYRSRPDLQPPSITINTRAPGTARGYIFAATLAAPGQRGPIIFDDTGDVVWFRPLTAATAMNVRVQRYRGAPVITWWEGELLAGWGRGECVIVDSSYREVARVRAGNGLAADLHEFELTRRRTAILTTYAPVPADLSAVGGPADGTVLESIVQEMDVASGEVILEWRARDHVDLSESYLTPTRGTPFDYFHTNSADVDTDGNLLVSARNTCTVYKVDRRTGQIIWRLGGKRGDFELGPGATFYWQHDARRQPDGTLTIFDNGASPPHEQSSRGITLALDERSMRAKLVSQVVHPSGTLTGAMGSIERLADGGAFVGWGFVSSPSFSEFAPDGKLRFDARFTGGGMSYRAFREHWDGRPSTRPRVAIAGAGGARTAYVSWNGATEVTQWRIDAGPSARRLHPVGTARRTGFETAIRIPAAARHVAVVALGRTGRPLGSSPLVRVR